MFDWLITIGVTIKSAVLLVASTLKSDAAPGLVTLALLIALLILIIVYLGRNYAQRTAIGWLRRLVIDNADRTAFAEGMSTLDHKVDTQATTRARKNIAMAWSEYRETLVPHEDDGVVIFRNAVRPSVFFNPEDLRFGAGSWRTIPGLFVSIGLFLTFLGLISALSSMDLTADKVQNSLRDLLTIASAKFIMSLTGLFCSILFTIVLRRGMAGLDHSIHDLCGTIEKRLTYISLEDLAVEQLAATREQREHFRMIGMELVAELGRPLKEDLPVAISNSISAAIAPIMQQVGQIGTDGMSEMVKGLSSRFTDDVERALTNASDSLKVAGERIAQMSARMDQSSGRVGAEMDSAVEKLTQAAADLRSAIGATAQSASGTFTQGAEQLLGVMNETLEGIRDNTSEGARALSAAAAEMHAAAQGFRAEIEKASASGAAAAREHIAAESENVAGAIGAAGKSVLAAVDRTTKEISDRTEEFARKAGENLLAPLGQITSGLGAIVETIGESASGLRRAADGVRAGADASQQAATAFKDSTTLLVGAVTPVHSANERIERAVSRLSESTSVAADSVVRSSKEVAVSASNTLAAAQEVLGGHGRAIEASLEQLGKMLSQLGEQSENLDNIDDKLGQAFQSYATHVATAVDSLFGHVRKMQDQLAPALDTLRTIVEQAEQFAPESGRRP